MRRTTRQRRAIQRVFVNADRPLGPKEILRAATMAVPRLGMATVYRNIRAMLEDGSLRGVELPGCPPRYELSGKDHHHHFHCRECDGVFEVEDCPDDLGALTPRGFELETHEIVLYGLCRTCVQHP